MKLNNRNYGRIDRTCGAGGFLNPPTHPEHSISVRSSYGDTFFMSLTAASESEWLNPATRGAARGILKAWKAPDINSEPIQDWIREVLGYFAGCYVGQNSKGELSWNCSDLRITKNVDPVLNADTHAGVHLIRKYYPYFVPTADHFQQAHWGTKA